MYIYIGLTLNPSFKSLFIFLRLPLIPAHAVPNYKPTVSLLYSVG